MKRSSLNLQTPINGWRKGGSKSARGPKLTELDVLCNGKKEMGDGAKERKMVA